MSEKEIEYLIRDLNELVIKGKLIDAFEKYYYEDVQMQENDLQPTVSKTANRQREKEFLTDIIDFRNAEVKGVGVDNNISFIIWHYDYTHKDWGVRNYIQVSAQEWKEGKIFKERFIYSN